MKGLLYILFALTLAPIALAQTPDTIRICTWNMRDLRATLPIPTSQSYRRVITMIDPDVLVIQESNSLASVKLLQSILQSEAIGKPMQIAPYFDGPERDVAMLYDSTTVAVIESAGHPTDGRPISHWMVIAKAHPDDTIHILGCHLTENNSEADSIERAREAGVIRTITDELPGHHHHVVIGTLSLYTASEQAYRILTQTGATSTGRVSDPLQRSGDWHGNPAFADLHTHSTRGGTDGGLDDRFDLILLSDQLLPYYGPGSYTTFGNDGLHFRDSVTAMPNLAVDAVTAGSLQYAIDHLPVYLDLVFGGPASGVEGEPVWMKEMDLSQRK